MRNTVDIEKINNIKNLSIKELERLSESIRNQIIETTKKNGGHLSSNLGIVDTTVALYHIFDFPNDKLIFDVGHQCYAHKILSGRAESFSSIRTDGGLSGFPDIDESEYDTFTTGHAGTSISSAIGLCKARDMVGDDYTVISVVGDASMVNGLNLEAMAVSSEKPKKLIVIFNDNGMSISKNVNGFYQYLSKKTTRRGYIKSKRAIIKIFGNSFVTKMLAGFKRFIKRIIGKYDRFEEFGFKYVGIIDGNDVGELVKILSSVKDASRGEAILLHVRTRKGKGHKRAEEKSDLYHGVGKNLRADSGDFSVELGKKLNELIKEDDKVVAITAGMKDGTGLVAVEAEHPNNFLDVGIAESFAVTSAAGMAKGGLKPFVAIYSTFMQRSYDQIMHDVCLQNLPVTLCLDRAGLVGKDGKTHQGVFDLSYLLHLPNLTVFAPSCVNELSYVIDYAAKLNGPVAIRYPKNQIEDRQCLPLEQGLWERIKAGNKVTLVAVGPKMLQLACQFAKEKDGVGVVNARTVKPLCEKTLEEIKDTVIVTLEENSVIGGFGALVSEYYSIKGQKVDLIIKGVPDSFVSHGSEQKQMEICGLTVGALEKDLKGFLI